MKEARHITSNPLFRPTPAAVTPTPINITSFLEYPNGVFSWLEDSSVLLVEFEELLLLGIVSFTVLWNPFLK